MKKKLFGPLNMPQMCEVKDVDLVVQPGELLEKRPAMLVLPRKEVVIFRVEGGGEK